MVLVEEACVHQVVVEDTVDILDLLAAEDNFEEDTADAHNVVPLVVDVGCKSVVALLVLVERMFA